MAFENIFQKLEASTDERSKPLKPVTTVWQQLSKDLYQNKVTGQKLTRIDLKGFRINLRRVRS